MPEYIYYTGVGSRKDGKHTIKQFLAIMNKNYGVACKLRKINEKAKTTIKECIAAEKILTRKYSKKDLKSNIPDREVKANKKLFQKCEDLKWKAMKTEPGCSINDYLEFSGAEHKK